MSTSTKRNNLAKAFDNFAGKRKTPLENDEERSSIPTVTSGSTVTSNVPACPSGSDQMDSKVNLNSGHVNPSSDEEISSVIKLADMLCTQLKLRECQSHKGSNISCQEKPTLNQFPQRENFERPIPSLPSCPSQHELLTTMQSQSSEPFLSQMEQKRKLQLGDPLAKYVLNNLQLLEGLGKSLDTEYKWYLEKKCWKHLAEYFGIEAEIYEDFTRYQERSPTEDLFEFLLTDKPEQFTIGKLKDKLRSIDRQDVQDVLFTHQDLHKQETDETQVGSLFDSHPVVIGKMAFLLDKETKGTMNWRQLADEFKVPRRESERFGDSIDDNPTKELFDYLNATQPRLTIGKVKEHLNQKDFRMKDVLDVIAESKKVNDSSPLKDLWEDLKIAARVCNLLNKKHTSMIRRWRFLGNELGVKKDVLDQFSKEEGEMISPTAVLIHRLSASKPGLKMANLIWALDKIGRSDAFSVVEDYFSAGVISKFLETVRTSLIKQQQQTTTSPYMETEIN